MKPTQDSDQHRHLELARLDAEIAALEEQLIAARQQLAELERKQA